MEDPELQEDPSKSSDQGAPGFVQEIKQVVKNASPELRRAIEEHGIVVTGGGAIPGLTEHLQKELGIPVSVRKEEK